MKLNRLLIWVIIIILLISTGCTKNKGQVSLSRTEFLMDTVITLKIYDKQEKKILDEAIHRLKEIENRMSTTINTSDVSNINKNAGIKPVKVHDDVYFVIKKAKYFAEISHGAYEPTIGPLVELWHITDGSGKERDTIPTKEEIEEKKSLVNYNDLELMEDNKVYLNKMGMKLDLGGIVKGYAADEVKRIFLSYGVGSAIIDLGGNVYALGGKQDTSSWKIGIQNPFAPIGNHMGILNIKDKSIVTSGDYERFFKYKGEKYHHIIDVKTGYPSRSGIAGVSIISDKSIDADALSTALFVLGVDEGNKLIKELEDIDAIFITKGKEVFIKNSLKHYFELTDNSLKLNIKSNY